MTRRLASSANPSMVGESPIVGDKDRLGHFSRRDRKHDERLVCAECGTISLPGERGWRGYRVDLADLDEQPGLVFYCSRCSQRELGE